MRQRRDVRHLGRFALVDAPDMSTSRTVVVGHHGVLVGKPGVHVLRRLLTTDRARPDGHRSGA